MELSSFDLLQHAKININVADSDVPVMCLEVLKVGSSLPKRERCIALMSVPQCLK